MRQGLMAKMASSDGLSRFSPESPCPLQKTPPNSGVHTTLSALIVLPTSVGIREDFLCCLTLSKASVEAGPFYLVRCWSFHWQISKGSIYTHCLYRSRRVYFPKNDC